MKLAIPRFALWSFGVLIFVLMTKIDLSTLLLAHSSVH